MSFSDARPRSTTTCATCLWATPTASPAGCSTGCGGRPASCVARALAVVADHGYAFDIPASKAGVW